MTLIEGERDPLALAHGAKGRMRSKISELAEALDSHFDDHHTQMARASLGRLDLVEQALVERDAVTAAKCAPANTRSTCCIHPWGGGGNVAKVIVAETGADMTRFPSAAHLAA